MRVRGTCDEWTDNLYITYAYRAQSFFHLISRPLFTLFYRMVSAPFSVSVERWMDGLLFIPSLTLEPVTQTQPLFMIQNFKSLSSLSHVFPSRSIPFKIRKFKTSRAHAVGPQCEFRPPICVFKIKHSNIHSNVLDWVKHPKRLRLSRRLASIIRHSNIQMKATSMRDNP